MYRLLLAVMLLYTVFSGMAHAVPIGTTPDTRPASPQQRKQWDTQGVSVQLSGSYLSGNVNMVSASGTLSYSLNLGQNQFFVDFGQLYTLAGTNVIANRLNSSLLYAYNLLDNFNLYGYSTHTRDDSIKLNYRLTNGVGVCFHKWLPEFFNLALVSLGAATENEWFQNQSTPFAVRMVLRLTFSKPITEWAELGLDSFYTPVIVDSSDFRVYSEAYLKFSLNEHVSFKLSVADEYDSRPLTGVQNNDFGAFTTLNLNFGH